MDPTPGDHRRFFERLCLLRELYERRGSLDREPVISVDEAVRLAWALGLEPGPRHATPSAN